MRRQVEHVEDYELAGRITKFNGSHDHGEGEIPGKIRVHVESEDGCRVAYMVSSPPLGSWVGLVGEWVVVDLGPAPGGGTYVEHQLDATGWDPLPEGFHPLLDGDLETWIEEYGWGNWV